MAYQSRSRSYGNRAGYNSRGGSADRNADAAPTQIAPAIMEVFNPSPQQQALFDWVEHGTGNAIVVAVAGAGKTTSLIQAAKRMGNARVVFLAYNKKIADEIGAKMLRAGVANATASTLHSAGRSAWVQAAPKMRQRNAFSEWKLNDIIKEMEPPDQFVGFIRKCVDLGRDWCIGVPGYAEIDDREAWNTLIDHFDLRDTLTKRGEESSGVDDDLVEAALNYAIDVLKKSNRMVYERGDFADMIYAPLLYGAHFEQPDWILVDESQDLNPARREMVKRMTGPHTRVIFVGDPCQAIYGFTGANADSMEIAKRDWNAIELPLTTTYRCPKAIVSVAQHYVSHIEAADSAPDGIYERIDKEDFDVWDRSAFGPDVAILCRNTAPLIAMCYDFVARDIACHVEGKEIGYALVKIATQWAKVRALHDLVSKLEAWLDKRVAELVAAKKQSQAEKVTDQVEALLAIIERMPKGSTVQDLTAKIESLFGDTPAGQPSPNMTLSTIHKAKGREWPTVIWYGANKFQPSKWAKLDWQKEQETNLMYVAATRAMGRLVQVDIND